MGLLQTFLFVLFVYNVNAFSLDFLYNSKDDPSDDARLQVRHVRDTPPQRQVLTMADADQYARNNQMQKKDSAEALFDYQEKFTWKSHERVLDLGSADGSFTNTTLKSLIPKDFEKLTGVDSDEKMVKYANEKYGDGKTIFVQLNIGDDVPETLKNNFNHIFSFYTLHWLKHKQQKVFQNIYDMLKINGETFNVFLGRMPVYDVFRALARKDQWKDHLKNIEDFVGPYHDEEDPAAKVKNYMERAGFLDVDVTLKVTVYYFENEQKVRKAVAAVNPFKRNMTINEEKQFLDEYMDIVKKLNITEHRDNQTAYRASYTLIKAFGRKRFNLPPPDARPRPPFTLPDAALYAANDEMQNRDCSDVLAQFQNNFTWQPHERVLDIGSADGGLTSTILKRYLPDDFEELKGSDADQKMVDYANKHNAEDKITFINLNITKNLTENLKNSYNHIFSFYTLHWLKGQQEKIFQNIHDMLVIGGETFNVFLGNMPIYDVFRGMARQEKWKNYLKDVETYVGAYHDFANPVLIVEEYMKKAGFVEMYVRSEQRNYDFHSERSVKEAVAAINPFEMSNETLEEFLNDYIEIVRSLNLIKYHDGKTTITANYTLITAFGRKTPEPVPRKPLTLEDVALYAANDELQNKDSLTALIDLRDSITFKSNEQVLDIGSGDGGFTKKTLKISVPEDIKKLTGSDVDMEMVNYANKHNSDNKTTYLQLDVTANCPETFKNSFDHIFSFFVIHRLKDKQQQAFQNIYDMLKVGGETFNVFLGNMPIYDVFRDMARQEKWKNDLKDTEAFIGVYHDNANPVPIVENYMKNAGFVGIDVRAKEETFVYHSNDSVRRAVEAVNPYKISADKKEEFLDDYMKVLSEMNLITLEYGQTKIRAVHTVITALGKKRS